MEGPSDISVRWRFLWTGLPPPAAHPGLCFAFFFVVRKVRSTESPSDFIPEMLISVNLSRCDALNDSANADQLNVSKCR